MTSDAKIGLLLGLVFVVVIAFLINGLPGLIGKHSQAQLVNASITDDRSEVTFGLTDQAELAVDRVHDFRRLNFPQRDTVIDTTQGGDSRFSQNPPAYADNSNAKYSDRITDGNTNNTQQTDNIIVDRAVNNTPRLYVVKPGDSLGKISKNVYGSELGNKQANVDKIFNANASTLNNPDDIYVGQKLIIPSLEPVQQIVKAVYQQNRTITQAPARRTENREVISISDEEKLMESGLFDKISNSVKNVIRKSRGQSPSLQSVYVVKDGDSLWEIASKKLGSGIRHKEIIKINSLKNADDLKVGMKLKLPVN